MTPERHSVEKALRRYDQAGEKTAVLALEVLATTAQMIATDMDRSISFVTDGFLITREPMTGTKGK